MDVKSLMEAPSGDNHRVGLGRELTPLEHTVLGILLRLGPCRAHAVVLEFSSSSTLAFRSKAGSIYPLMKRLAKAGFVNYADKRYRLAPAGRRALQEWLRPPLDEGEVSTNLDTLRTRFYFMEVLTKDEVFSYLDFVETELGHMLSKLESTKRLHVELGDRFGELAIIGAFKETEARISWIREVRKLLMADFPYEDATSEKP